MMFVYPRFSTNCQLVRTLLEKCNIYLNMYIVGKCNIYLYMYIVRKCNIYLYMYIVGKCNIYLYNLYKQVEKGAFDQLFLPVLQRVQMNFIFTDNLHYYNYTCIVLILTCTNTYYIFPTMYIYYTSISYLFVRSNFLFVQ
jgi:hypothetical protein